MKEVCITWATKKRHISIDGVVLCEPKFGTAGYSVKNRQYNSISLHGIVKSPYTADDKSHTHYAGMIEYAPLDKQKYFIDTKSICTKCLKRYNKELEAAKLQNA